MLRRLFETLTQGRSRPAASPEARLLQAVAPYTMVGPERLANVYEMAQRAEATGLDGAFVECGVWRGGCVAIMAQVAERAGHGRKTWLFDSFEGLPEPDERDGAEAHQYAAGRMGGALKPIDQCVAPMTAVHELLFERLGLDPAPIEIVKGWFQDTLPEARARIGPIALLRLDGDWYESTRVCFEALYDQVVPGGIVIIDDYGHWEGCRKATDEFMAARGIQAPLIAIDYTGRYFIKPA